MKWMYRIYVIYESDIIIFEVLRTLINIHKTFTTKHKN